MKRVCTCLILSQLMLLPLTSIAQNKTKITKNDFTKELKFKVWLRDTLTKLHANKAFLIRRSPKNKLSLSADSLGLEINSYYHIKIDFNKSMSRYVHSVINLLKDYDESPKNGSVLDFTIYTYYYSSSINKNYDFEFEVKDIYVIEARSKKTYDYIRGRLSGETEIITQGVNKGREYKYEFNWSNHHHFKKVLLN